MFDNFILKNKRNKSQEFLTAIEREFGEITDEIKKIFLDYMLLAETSPSHKHDSIDVVYSQVFLILVKGTYFHIYENDKMVAFASWSTFSKEVHDTKLIKHVGLLELSDYESGNNLWLLDVIAPYGHYKKMIKMLVNMKSNNEQIKNSIVNYRRFYGNANKARFGTSTC